MVLPGSDKGDYDAVSETWFGCNIPWLQPRCISISSNLDKAIVYPRGRPSAWLNPIDMAAACGECFSPGGAAPGWFQRFGGGGTSCCPGVLTRLPGDDAYLQMMLDRLRGPGVWDDCATFGFNFHPTQGRTRSWFSRCQFSTLGCYLRTFINFRSSSVLV